MELPYAALQLLCASMLPQIDVLPSPQRDALRIAFGLEDGPPPDRFKVGLAVLGLLSGVAEVLPVICIVDDAQWLDQVSAEVLAFVGRRLLAEKVALVFAAREPSGRRASALDGLERFAVHGLTDDDARALLDSAIHAPMDEQVRSRIVAETRGNPLALLELPRGLTRSQLAGGFGFPDAKTLTSEIERGFLQRLSRLPRQTQRLLLVAAAEPIGDVPLLWRAATWLSIGMEAASPAEAAGLLEIGSHVRFRHPLVRSAAYRAASEDERRKAHRALGEATDPELDPDRRAWHRARAAPGPDEEVAGELEVSAQRAQARGGAAATAAFLERATSLTPEPGPRAQRGLAAASAEREAGGLDAALALLSAVEHGPPDPLRAAEVERLRGIIAFDRRRGSDAARLLAGAARRLEPLDVERARETHLEALGAALWADGLSGPSLVRGPAAAAVEAPASRQPPRPSDVVLDALATRITHGYTPAVSLLKRALAVLRDRGVDQRDSRRLWLAGSNLGGIIALEVWDSESRHALGVHQLQVARKTGALVQVQLGLNYMANTNLLAGELSVAASQIDEDRSISEVTGNAPVGYTALALAAFRGREIEASELIRETVDSAERQGQGRIVSFATYASAVLYNGLGRYDAARDAAAPVFERDVIGYGTVVVSELAEAASRTGDTGLLGATLDWIRERTLATPTDWAVGIEARIRALLGDGEVADRHYQESIDRLSRTRLRAELGRGHLLYGEWLRRNGRRIDSREQLQTAHGMLTTMGLEGFARRAASELEATGAKARKRTVVTRDDLTAQEERIARLAGEGLSNPQIGIQLFLSPRTVEWHLHKVFSKLGISSRTQLRGALPEPVFAGEFA
jgi:DNA-binding CsgD family transcriptional regulator